MFRDAMDNLRVLKGQWRPGLEYDTGLGFLGPGLLIDQHFLKRGRIGRMLPALWSLGCRRGLGVDENAAVVIQGPRLEVIGGSGAVLVDLAGTDSDASLPAFNLRGVRLSYLASGDAHDLDSGVTTPSPRKQALPCIVPADPGFRPVRRSERYFLDFLGDGCLLGAMRQLLHGPQDEVRGLACRVPPQPDDPAPDLGFEFRLRRAPGLRGWCGVLPGGDDDTVLEACLDVVPVRVANPLCTPLAALPGAEAAALLTGRQAP